MVLRNSGFMIPGLSSWDSGNHPFSGGGVTVVSTPPIRVMSWGPRTGAAGPATILCVRQLGSQALLFAPQKVRYLWIFGFYRYPWTLDPRILSVPCVARYRWSPKIQGCQFGVHLDLWTFGFLVPPEIRYPSVGALGSWDAIGVLHCQVPMESGDPVVPAVYWGFVRVVWFFRFSA